VPEIEPIRWRDTHLELLDQTLLPREQRWLAVARCDQAIAAVREMRVRGAPAIGVTAGYAMALAARETPDAPMPRWLAELTEAAARIAAARPTAVNLGWAVERSLGVARQCATPTEARERLLAEAERMRAEDVAMNRAIAAFGEPLVPAHGGVLTHCNTGALATAGIGTALGVIRGAWEAGKRPAVFHTETRPWLQGARLTAWEFQQLGIPAQLIVDSAAAALMRRGEITSVIVGADRIAANGDTANKIGTYGLAVLAHAHGIPFQVAAPFSSIDLRIATGDAIAIEERPAHEVTRIAGQAIAPDGVAARNPVFDVTPARLIAAIVTERGVARPPYVESLRALAGRPAVAT